MNLSLYPRRMSAVALLGDLGHWAYRKAAKDAKGAKVLI